MQTKGKKSLKVFSETPLSKIIKALRASHGSKAEVCRKLGDGSKAAQVRLGQYEQGRQRPKADFFEAWKSAFGDDLLALERQTNVSRGTKSKQNITPVPEPALKEKEPDIRYVKLLEDNLKTANEYIQELKAKADRYKKDLDDCLQGRK